MTDEQDKAKIKYQKSLTQLAMDTHTNPKHVQYITDVTAYVYLLETKVKAAEIHERNHR